jgi:signal transduction histidine kinase
MQTEVNILDFVIPFIGGILIFSMLILFIIYFIIIYRRKQVEFEYEKEKAKQLLLKTEIEIKEQTLSHISRELHDNLGQVASLIKINLGMIKPVNDTQISQLSESKELIKQLTQDIKSLSTTLKGENLKRFGLYKMVLKDIDRFLLQK